MICMILGKGTSPSCVSEQTPPIKEKKIKKIKGRSMNQLIITEVDFNQTYKKVCHWA